MLSFDLHESFVLCCYQGLSKNGKDDQSSNDTILTRLVDWQHCEREHKWIDGVVFKVSK